MKAGLFPGQGIPADVVLAALPADEPLLETAQPILGYELRRKIAIAARRTQATLPTSVAQPAIFVAGVAAFQRAGEEGRTFDVLAGHSLGEYTALVAGDSMSFAEGLRAVAIRGEAMQEAARRHPGGMVAVLGLDMDEVEAIADKSEVVLANDNAPGQVVLAGSESGLAEAASFIRSAGGRAVLLDVSGPFHTDAMTAAREALAAALEDIEIRSPSVPVISNVTARPYETPEDIRTLLVEQLTTRVRFRESLEWLWQEGTDEYEDLGPGRVAAGLAQRTFGALRRTREAARA